MPDAKARERARIMTKLLQTWVDESAGDLFAVKNLRGSLVLNFDTSTGALHIVARTVAVMEEGPPVIAN